MNTKPIIPEATLQRVLSSQRRPMRSHTIEGVVAARLASEFAEGLTLVTDAILGLETTYGATDPNSQDADVGAGAPRDPHRK